LSSNQLYLGPSFGKPRDRMDIGVGFERLRGDIRTVLYENTPQGESSWKVHQSSQSFLDYHSTDRQLTCNESSYYSSNCIRRNIRHGGKATVMEYLIELTTNRQKDG